MSRFQNRIALVTGASRGIGAAIADLAKTIVDAWSGELPDIVAKPE